MTRNEPATGTIRDITPQRTKSVFLRAIFGTVRGRVGLVFIGAVVLIAFLGPFAAPHGITDFVAPAFSGPSAQAWLGTDGLGRDVLSRALNGGVSLLIMAFLSTVLGVFAGAVVGMVAAYIGGRTGEVIMRIIDVLLAFPYIVLVLLFLSMVGPQPWLLVTLLAVGWLPLVARMCYGVTLSLLSQEFIQAMEAIGAPRREIVFREILPNLTTPLLVQFGQYLAWSIAGLAGLSFLGFGLQPPSPDWGLMLNENRAAMGIQPWGVVVPIILIAIFTIGANLLAEAYARAVSGTGEGGAA